MNTIAAPDMLLARMGALGDPVRLRALALLEAHELGVGEIAAVLQLPQSSTSRHLRQLADAGWLVVRNERTASLYRMPIDELDEGMTRLWSLSRAQIDGWPVLDHDRLRLAQRLSERRSAFADVADEWDDLRAELYGTAFTDTALRALLPRDWVVADLACGTGAAAAALAGRVARVIGVDSQPEMLAAAARRDLPGVELREGDLAALPIADGECDAAVCMLALTFVHDPAAALAEMHRILRPGGRAVIVEVMRHGRDDFRRRLGAVRDGFAAQELRDSVALAGFEHVSCNPLPPDSQAKGPALLLVSAERTAT